METKREKELLKQIGEKIRILRTEIGLTQYELATKANIGDNQIGRIERAEIISSIITLDKIANALEVNIQDLFSK